MPPTAPTLSIVIPCCNEADIVENLLRDWVKIADGSFPHYEIVIVNDGSSDGTGRILDKLRKEIRSVRVIHQLRSGHAWAIRRGVEVARGDYVVVADADERYEPSDLLRLWEAKGDNVLVVAVRTHRVEGILRGLGTEALKRIGKWLFGVAVQDPTSCFQLIRRDVLVGYLAAIPKPMESLNCSLNYLLAREFPGQVTEVPIHYGAPRRPARRQKLTRTLRGGLTLAADLIKTRSLVSPPEVLLSSSPLHA